MSKKDLSILDNQQYDVLDPILQGYYEKYVQMEEEKRKFIVGKLNEKIEEIVEGLKNTNTIFMKYFNRIVYTGSYWERVRVKEATEYDVNLVFKLPNGIKIRSDYPPGFAFINLDDDDKKNKKFIATGNSHQRKRVIQEEIPLLMADYPPGYAFFNLTDIPRGGHHIRYPHHHYFHPRERTIPKVVQKIYKTPSATNEEYRELLHWTEKTGTTITPDRFLSWLESVFQKAGIILCQSYSKNGPALTLTMDFDKRVTVDFTPVFEVFENNNEESWFAVPKPYKTYKSFKKTWRISLCEKEKQILKKQKMLKFILKLMKKIRDNLQINKLSSYHIKTLFLLEQNNLDWSKHSGRLFMHMMNKMEVALDKQCLPSFVDNRFNLFDSLDDGTMKNMYGQIKNFIQELRLILNRSENKNQAILDLFGNF